MLTTKSPEPLQQLYLEVEKTELIHDDRPKTREEIAQRRVELKQAMDLLKKNTPSIRHLRMR